MSRIATPNMDKAKRIEQTVEWLNTIPMDPVEVWIVTWHSQDTNQSGVRGVFASEEDARTIVNIAQQAPKRIVYRCSQWMVMPDTGKPRM